MWSQREESICCKSNQLLITAYPIQVLEHASLKNSYVNLKCIDIFTPQTKCIHQLLLIFQSHMFCLKQLLTVLEEGRNFSKAQDERSGSLKWNEGIFPGSIILLNAQHNGMQKSFCNHILIIKIEHRKCCNQQMLEI